MGAKTDEVKGKVKEKTGKWTGDKKLEREGKIDQATGKAKEWVNEAGEKLKKQAA